MARSELSGETAGGVAQSRNPGEFAPGRLRGRPVSDLLRNEDVRPLWTSIRIAILNAMAASLTGQAGCRILANRDPLEWVDASAGKTVVLVGAFQSLMDKLAGQPCRLRVLELDPGAIPERHRRFYVPAAQAPEILPLAHSVVLTGSTLVNHTLDGLLACITPGTFTALAGPSAGLPPAILFRKGISLIGTIRILDPETMFTVVEEGGAGYHLFRTCAEKICILHS